MTATVEEYHPEVVKFVTALSRRLVYEHKFDGLVFDVACRGNAEDSATRLIQFLLSECATPLKQGAPQ